MAMVITAKHYRTLATICMLAVHYDCTYCLYFSINTV